MPRIPLLVGLVAAVAVCAGGHPTAAQTDEDEITAIVNGMTEAVAKADWDALGQLICESGFVGVISLEGDAKCYTRDDLLAYLRSLAPATGLSDTLRVEDLKVEVHHTVAFINAKLTLPPQAPLQRVFLDAVVFREMGKWQLCALMVAPEEAEPNEETVKTLVDHVAALPTAAENADLDSVQKALDDDHFILCYVDPSMELRWATSKAALIGMIQGVLRMISIKESQLDVTRTQAGKTAVAVDGRWLLEITDFGQTTSAMRAYAVKMGDEWKIVALAGGPTG